MNQLYIYIYLHISSLLHLPHTLHTPPLEVVTKHLADIPVLCSCFPLAIYFTFGSIYKSMPLSHFVPAYPSPSPCPQVHSLHLCLYSCPAPRFFRTFFFLIPYICVSIWYLFLSFWLTSLCITDSRSIHLTTNNSIFYGWVIFLCIYVPHLPYPSICQWTLAKAILGREKKSTGIILPDFKLELSISICRRLVSGPPVDTKLCGCSSPPYKNGILFAYNLYTSSHVL